MPRKPNKKKTGRKPRPKAVQRRAVEVKRREDADIQVRNSTNGYGSPGTFSGNYPDTFKVGAQLPTTTSVTMLPLRSFLRMSRGERKNQMTGNQVMSKSIYLKGKLGEWDKNNAIWSPGTSFSNKIYLVCGWIKDSTGYTDFTSPSLATATRNDVEDFIFNQLKQHFDDSSDEMRYREAKKDNIKIDKYQLLTVGDDTLGANEDGISFKAYWKTNRKTLYSECTRLAGSNELLQTSSAQPTQTINMTDQFKESGDTLGGDSGGFIPNNSWLPFACLYQPFPQGEQAGVAQPAVIYNSIHYFTDL